MISPAHAICLAAFVLVLPAMNSPAWCQTDGSPQTGQIDAKEASKARKEALKKAEKAINTGDIDQLRAILEANPGLVSASTPQSVAAGVAAAVIFGPVLAYDAQANVTLLHDAAEGNRKTTEGKRKEMVELLLSYHANVNARNGFGYTPLHIAIMSQSTDIVQLLLDNGADINARAKNGDTPLKLVIWLKRTRTKAIPLQPYLDIEQLLLQHGAHK
jgi:hypothetical protein